MPSIAQREPDALPSKNIFLAASENDLDTVRAHLAAGADVNSLDEHGYSCLHAAASYAHLTLLDLLVSAGGDINLADHDGDTPLFVVETAAMAALLVACGADTAWRNKAGLTALAHHEEEDEFPEVVAYLRTVTPGVSTIEGDGQGQGQTGETVALPDGSTVHYASNDTSTDANEAVAQALSQEQRDRIDALMQQSQEDGINRDAELSQIIESALLGSGLWQQGTTETEEEEVGMPATSKARHT